MSLSPEITQVVLEILRIGILRIRALGWSGDAHRCAIEADHIHNLPALLANSSPDLLNYYLDVERAAFIGQSADASNSVEQFEPLWRKLESLMADPPSKALSR
jgi:hypothetical protein